MIRSRLLWLSACLIATQFAGCATTESWRTSNNNSIRSAKSKSKPLETADSDTEDEDEEDRLKYVGSDGRADLARDEPLDPWFGKYNYAEKGRAIERNLGQ